MRNHAQEYMVSAQYFAPRGKERLMFLGEQISHRHLFFNDRLIGILGDAGAGKSSFIKGMFPGLQLSNDDDIVNPRKIMQVRNPLNDIEDATTYHFDVRFQMAFMQMYEIADFVRSLLERKRRVVVEHFNLLYDALGRNADLLVGIGEEIIVARPGVFGPLPQSIYDIVHESLKYRKMAHSAEDITTLLLSDEFGISDDDYYFSDVRNGFMLKFRQRPEIDIPHLEARVRERIAEHLHIAYHDEDHVRIGDRVIPCDGPRFHVRNTSEIIDFSLHKTLVEDPKTGHFCLIGFIDDPQEDVSNRNTHYFLARNYQ